MIIYVAFVCILGSCLCMASGDPHYKTYDGQIIHFMGICKYLLTKSTKPQDKCAFSIEVKNYRRESNEKVSYTREVDLNIYGKKISLLQGRNVMVS